jgi:hypothetical protein
MHISPQNSCLFTNNLNINYIIHSNYIEITYYGIIKFNFLQPQRPTSALNHSPSFEIQVSNRGHRFLQPPCRQVVHFLSRFPRRTVRHKCLSISLSPTRPVPGHMFAYIHFLLPRDPSLLAYFAVPFAPCGRGPYPFASLLRVCSWQHFRVPRRSISFNDAFCDIAAAQ